MPDSSHNPIAYFAQTNFRNSNQKFGIKKADRRRHMYLIGKTGVGKSTLLENMIYSDVHNNQGLAVIDPHGDLIQKILNFIPSYRINDVIYFNPADLEYPIAFNILNTELKNHTSKQLLTSGLISVFKKIYSEFWGPRLEYILRNCILTLIASPGNTLLGIPRLLTDQAYQKRLVAKVSDPLVKNFWESEFAQYHSKFKAEVIAPIQNKIGQFLSDSMIRNIIGQTKNSLNLRKIMDSGQVLLVDLSKGKIGEDNATLLGALIVIKLQLAALSRVDISEEERRDFYLYVDEFQAFATDSFAEILAEARKYRLNLILAHQYLDQLDQNVRSALLGNVGTMLIFRVGASDAKILEEELYPVFNREDLINLPQFHIFLKLMIDGTASKPFSAITLPAFSIDTVKNNLIKIICNSQNRYSWEKWVVEGKINRWINRKY